MLTLPKTEQSFWRDSYADSLYPTLTGEHNFDVAVIGAGITGLTAAYYLKNSGLSVVVCEKSTVGGGTTGRTTGKITSQHELVYDRLTQRFGAPISRLYGQANQAAIEMIAGIIKNEKIPCDWQEDDNLVFTTDADKVQDLLKETQLAIEYGLPASFETSSPLPFKIAGAMKFGGQAKFHSQKYLLGLAKAVHGDGSGIYEHSEVTSIRDGSPCRVKTKQAVITAKHIIVATNVPTFPLLARGGYCIYEYPTESFAVAGPLAMDLKGMYISPDKEHYSVQPIDTKEGRMLIVVGEGGRLPGLTLNKQKHYQKLADYAERHFGLSTITHSWSDRDYRTYDIVPVAGKVYPWSKNLYTATAFKKWGLTNGTAAAKVLADTILGKPNPWTELYRSNRLRSVASIPYGVMDYLQKKS